MSDITQPLKSCWSCRSKIAADAKVCTECAAYQDWRRHISTTNVVAAALVSVIALVSPLKSSFEYFWNLCCTSKTIGFSLVQPLTLSNYEIERRLQVSKLSGAIAITNTTGKDAVISAVLVEHVGLGSQSYLVEGCGYRELSNIVVKTNGDIVVIPFEMEYWVLLVEQNAPFETIFNTDKFQRNMSGAGEDMKEDVARNGSVLLLWTDGNGSNRQTVAKGQRGFLKRVIQYPGTEAEFKQGGFNNPYCFSKEARKRVGIKDEVISRK